MTRAGHAYLVDTGPLVALLNARDGHHAWAKEVFGKIAAPLLTCESVISEACFLVRKLDRGRDTVLSLVEDGIVQVSFDLGAEVTAVRALMQRYANVPMSLADASLVRMSELSPRSTVITLDQDFAIYRRNKRQNIPRLSPE